MADVRSLLRNERASRRIDHPHATYSSKNILLCRVCNLQLKSDSLWSGHIRSSQHQMKAQRLRDSGDTNIISNASTAIPATKDNAKRRRVEEEDSAVNQGTFKRAKSGPGAIPEGFFDAPSDLEEAAATSNEQKPTTELVERTVISSALPSATPTNPESNTNVDEDEWAAFEAEMAQAEEEAATISSDAIISAPALTAEQIAAQAREEQSTQHESKEVEMAAEKEDAVRKLEEEFDEMAALEAKLQQLKEKREAIRAKDVPRHPLSIEMKPPPDSNVESDEDDTDDEDDFVFFHGRV